MNCFTIKRGCVGIGIRLWYRNDAGYFINLGLNPSSIEEECDHPLFRARQVPIQRTKGASYLSIADMPEPVIRTTNLRRVEDPEAENGKAFQLPANLRENPFHVLTLAAAGFRPDTKDRDRILVLLDDTLEGTLEEVSERTTEYINCGAEVIATGHWRNGEKLVEENGRKIMKRRIMSSRLLVLTADCKDIPYMPNIFVTPVLYHINCKYKGLNLFPTVRKA